MVNRRKTRQRMADIVGDRRAAIVDGDAGEAGAEQHLAARFDVAGLLHRRFQCAGDQPQRLDARRTCAPRCVLRFVAASKAWMKASRPHQAVRLAGSVVVRAGSRMHEIGLGFRPPDPEFLALRTCKDIGGRGFRAGAGRRWHHDLLQRILRERIGGQCIEHRIFARRCATGDDLGDIQRRAAADADHHIRALGRLYRRADMRELRFAGEIREDLHGEARFSQIGLDLVRKTGSGQERIDHQKSGGNAIEGFDGCGKAGQRTAAKADVWNDRNGKGHEITWKSAANSMP